jgi:UDP-N-acetylmuramyl pentapeptide synthase
MNKNVIENLYSLFLKSSGVIIDSRKAHNGEIFFALKGENTDGNKYGSSNKKRSNCRSNRQLQL